MTSIRYAEITVIKNLQKEHMYHYVSRLFGNEIKITDDDTIIIQFDDESIYDTSNIQEEKYQEDNSYTEYSDSDESDTETEICSYNNTETKYEEDSETESKIDSYDNANVNELDTIGKSRIILGMKFYSPYLAMGSFILKGTLFQLKLPEENYNIISGNYTISYKSLFPPVTSSTNLNERIKYPRSIRKPSIYNMIYYHTENRMFHNTIDSFGIIKIESSETKPRFVVAYLDKYFKKQDIIYLVDHILKFKY